MKSLFKIKLNNYRSTVYLRQVKLSFFYKILSVVFSLLTVPLMIKYLGSEKYGIWATLLSLTSWLQLCDFGLMLGTRNRVAEHLATNEICQARGVISTSYLLSFFFTVLIFVFFFLANSHINWQFFFNTTDLKKCELQHLLLITFSFMSINLTASIINQLFYATQKSSLVVLGQLLANFMFLLSIYFLLKTTTNDIVYLSLVYGGTSLTSYISISFIFFKSNPNLIPSIFQFQGHHIKNIFTLSFRFFIIQLAALVLFATDRLILIQILGPASVVEYDIIYKYFSVFLMMHSLIIAPLWSGFTESYAQRDYLWIKRVLQKLNQLMGLYFVTISFFVFLGEVIIKIWVGEKVPIHNSTMIYMGVFIFFTIWNNNYAYFVNGINKLTPQLYSAILAGIINIPLSIFFAKNLSMGVNGIILGTISSLSIFAIIGPIQTYYIVGTLNEKHNS